MNESKTAKSRAIANAIFCLICISLIISINSSLIILSSMTIMAVCAISSHKIERKRIRLAALIILNSIFVAPVLILFLFYSSATNLDDFSVFYPKNPNPRILKHNEKSNTESRQPKKTTKNYKETITRNHSLGPNLLCPDDLETQFKNYAKTFQTKKTKNPWKGKNILCSNFWLYMTGMSNMKIISLYDDAITFDSIMTSKGSLIKIEFAKNTKNVYDY